MCCASSPCHIPRLMRIFVEARPWEAALRPKPDRHQRLFGGKAVDFFRSILRRG
jgi:hypothetical protein